MSTTEKLLSLARQERPQAKLHDPDVIHLALWVLDNPVWTDLRALEVLRRFRLLNLDTP